MEILRSLPIQSFLLVLPDEFHIKDLIENFSVSSTPSLTNENQDSKQFPHVSNIDYFINLSAIGVVCMRANSPTLMCIKIRKYNIKMLAARRLCNWNKSGDAHHRSLYSTKQNFNGLCLFLSMVLTMSHSSSTSRHWRTNDDSLADFKMSGAG